MSTSPPRSWTVDERLAALHLDDFTDDERTRARRYRLGYRLLGTAINLSIDLAIAQVVVERKHPTSPATST